MHPSQARFVVHHELITDEMAAVAQLATSLRGARNIGWASVRESHEARGTIFIWHAPPGRRFRLRLKPGRGVVRSYPDARQLDAESDGDGAEIIASEEEAAFLVRQRAVDIIEVLDERQGREGQHQFSWNLGLAWANVRE